MIADIVTLLGSKLTPAQQAAALDKSSEVLTLACAGSGKSRTLAYRIARLIADGDTAESIVAFTFTNKAAESIKLRVATALQDAGLDPMQLGAMYIGTIDAYCGSLLGDMEPRYRQFEQLDGNRLVLFLLSRYGDLAIKPLQDGRNAKYFDSIGKVSHAWQTINNELIQIAAVDAVDSALGEVLNRLKSLLNASQYTDFSMTIRCVTDALIQGEPQVLRAVSTLKHLMVDEYQDVNPVQERLITELHKLSETLFVVGDDDQAIYSWRGADVNNIQEFDQRYPNCSTHTLAINFRSTRSIVAASDKFAHEELSATRTVKNPVADSSPSPRDFRNLWFDYRDEEAKWIVDRIQALLGTEYVEKDGTVRGLTPSDFAILMRSTGSPEQNAVPRHGAYTQILTSTGIPYTLESGGSVFDRIQVSVLRDAFSLLRDGPITQPEAEDFFLNTVLPAYPHAKSKDFRETLRHWAREIHAPPGGARRRVYPQQLVHDLLCDFGLALSNFDDGVMSDIGIFSRIIQDVETVYLSVDSKNRFAEILNFLQNPAQTGYQSTTDDIVGRPDAVTVTTIHKMKGLEFPVVFVVDMEEQRFPGKMRSYDGWLPLSLMGPILARGAYIGNDASEARLFFTALTRAERYLYVTGSRLLPNGKRLAKQSSFALRLADVELSSDKAGLPSGLSPAPQKRRIDEDIVPTSYSDIRYYLRCPYEYKLRKVFGFSPAISEMFGFGKTVHTALGKLHQDFKVSQGLAPSRREAEAVAHDVFHLKHVYPSNDPQNNPGPYERARDVAGDMLGNYVESFSDDFLQRRELEQRFEVPVKQAVITGAIDLMLKEDAQGNILDAAVVDFKSLKGGNNPEQNEKLQWTELALQVQLYAKAADKVLGQNAKTGSVHFLKDSERVDVPITSAAIEAAVNNVEWAVQRIIEADFPKRPNNVEGGKCDTCDFKLICSRKAERFRTSSRPLPIHIPGPSHEKEARIFSDYDGSQ